MQKSKFRSNRNSFLVVKNVYRPLPSTPPPTPLNPKEKGSVEGENVFGHILGSINDPAMKFEQWLRGVGRMLQFLSQLLSHVLERIRGS